MAMADDWLGKLRGADAEAKRIQKADAEQRKKAEKADNSIIFNTRDLSGKYDPARELKTTLGGVQRSITHDDIVAFKNRVQQLESQRLISGGITARQVIDMANVIVSGDESDLKRANREISMAQPVAFSTNKKDGAGLVRFITNAGPASNVSRHHVQVEFLGFKSAANGSKEDIKKAALALCRQPLRFNCDCGRHKYWFRYIATIGGFNVGTPFGRDEFGYPKIRNPNLAGVACKHVLRVMANIESSIIVTHFLTKAIAAAIESGKAQTKLRATQKEAEEQAKKSKANKIKTTSERAADALRAKERKAAADAVKKANPPKKQPRKPSNQQILKNQAIEAIKRLNLSSEIESAMIAQINAG